MIKYAGMDEKVVGSHMELGALDLEIEIADLDLPVRTVGRALKEIRTEITRELTAEDMKTRQVEQGIKPEPIQKMRARHHLFAQLIAQGESLITVGIVCGYTVSRASILANDPSVRELIRYYGKQNELSLTDIHQKLVGLGIDALDEMSNRLENNPDDISNTMLRELITTTADRIGHGPQSSSTNTNINIDTAGRLERARIRMKTIEAEAKEIPDAPQSD